MPLVKTKIKKFLTGEKFKNFLTKKDPNLSSISVKATIIKTLTKTKSCWVSLGKLTAKLDIFVHYSACLQRVKICVYTDDDMGPFPALDFVKAEFVKTV